MMCLSAMGRFLRSHSLSRHVSRRVCCDDRAAIEPRADPDVQPPGARRKARPACESLGFLGRVRKRKAGWSPGALPDADRALVGERRKGCSHVGTAEAFSPLGWREVIAEPHLQF